MRAAACVLFLLAACGEQRTWDDSPNPISEPCLVTPFLAAVNLAGNAGMAAQFENPAQDVIFTRADFDNVDGPPAFLSLSLWEGAGVFNGGFRTGGFLLGGKETDLKSCGVCLSIGTESLLGAGRQSYFAYFGSVTIEEIEPTPGGRLVAHITDLRLREVVYGEDGTQTDSTSGCQIGIDDIDINMSVQAF